jgi:hypothetical protein
MPSSWRQSYGRRVLINANQLIPPACNTGQRPIRVERTAGTLGKNKPRLKLCQEEYDLLRRQILDRDGWRRQIGGLSRNLQVHHLKFRSKLGDDRPDNLLTLCAVYRRQQHNKAHWLMVESILGRLSSCANRLNHIPRIWSKRKRWEASQARRTAP